MSLLLIIAGAVFGAVLVVGLVLWSSMKVTERREITGTSDSGGAVGYQEPGDLCDTDGGGCD